MLVEREHDRVAAREPVEHRVERAALGHDAEAGSFETAHDQAVEPVGLERAAHEVEASAHLRKASDARDGRNLPVSEVSRQQEHTLALVIRVDERVQVLDAHQRELALAREPAEAQELAEEAPEVAVMRLREIEHVVVVERRAEDAPQVVEDDPAAEREQVVEHAARERDTDRRGLRNRDRGRARPVVRHRQCDRAQVIAAREQFRARAQDNLRRAEVIAHHAEVVRLDLRKRSFALEQLDARFLGGKACREACRTARPFARVRQFLRRKEARQILVRVLGKQPLDSDDLDRIDTAALRRGSHVLRITNAALVPANPRHSTSATGPRGT